LPELHDAAIASNGSSIRQLPNQPNLPSYFRIGDTANDSNSNNTCRPDNCRSSSDIENDERMARQYKHHFKLVTHKIMQLIDSKFDNRDTKVVNQSGNKKRKLNDGMGKMSKPMIKIGCFNLHGLQGREEFANSLSFDLDILFFCESLCDSQLKTASYFCTPDRRIYSKNAKCEKKSGRPSGGIGFVVNDTLNCKANMSGPDWMATLTISNLMVIGVHLTHESGTRGEEVLEAQLAEVALEIEQCKSISREFLLIGDFNVDFKKPSGKRDLMNNFIFENGLKVDDLLHLQSTQITFRSFMGSSWIDHCASMQNNQSIKNCTIMTHKENKSDHNPIIIDYEVKETNDHPLIKRRILKKRVKINFKNNEFLKGFKERIDPIIDRCNELMDKIVSLCVTDKLKKEEISNEIYTLLTKGLCDSTIKSHNFVVNAPKLMKRSRKRKKLNKWWDDELKILHLKQCHAYQLYALTEYKGVDEKLKYNEAKKAFKNVKDFKKKLKSCSLFRYVNNLFHLDRNSFWSQIKRMERKSNNINIDLEKLKTEYEKIFNEPYTSKEDVARKQVEVDAYIKKNQTEKFKNKTESFVIQGLINELKCGKSIGLRGVSNEMLKYCSSAKLVPVIARFYDCIINEQVLPIGFNVSVIKPILKSENKPNNDISNTRPVAISDAIQNLYERLLLWKLNKTHKEHDQQFGFKRNSSCSHAIFVVSQVANFAKQNGKRLYTCAIDASKAFDKVSRPHLWLKLIHLAIAPEIVLAIIHYYSESFMVVQLDDVFSTAFKTTNGVRQGGVMSPKLFAIFVDDLIKELEAAGLGVKIGHLRISVVMYADDLLIMSETRERVNGLLSIADKYGSAHGIKFNPDKTELIVFNHNVRRSASSINEDNWTGELTLSGSPLKVSSSIRYLGVMLSDNLSAKIHLKKRRAAMFAALARIAKLGFTDVKTGAMLKGNMFKVYIRSIDLTKTELTELTRIESLAIKKLFGISNDCYVTELLRALNIELSDEWFWTMKLKFVGRLLSNKFTRNLYEELENLRIEDSLPVCVNRLLRPFTNVKHLNGIQFTLLEKCRCMVDGLISFGRKEANCSDTAHLIRKILSVESMRMIPLLLYFFLNSRGADEFWYKSFD